MVSVEPVDEEDSSAHLPHKKASESQSGGGQRAVSPLVVKPCILFVGDFFDRRFRLYQILNLSNPWLVFVRSCLRLRCARGSVVPFPSLVKFEIQYDHFYTYAEIDAFCAELASAYPDLCRVGSIGSSREGRAIQLLTLTDFVSGNADDRPAFVIHGGIHAHEPASAHAPLYTALQLLQDHEADGLLSRVTFYIVPRLSPDASEFCIATSTRVRSRTDFDNRECNVIYPEDIDGNGLILEIRQQHPEGGLVADPEEPRLVVKRREDSSGPFYRVFPEGLIHDWDDGDCILQGGMQSFIPSTRELAGGRTFDWNRNWPYNWRPEQIGAGDYPFSELELRHFADFLFAHHRIFAILGYHCGHASVIRPPASGSRDDLDPDDDRLIEELAQIGVRHTNTHILPLVTEDNPGKGGHSLDTIYHHLGVLGFVLELGTVTNNAGLTTEEWLQWEDGDLDRWNRRLLVWWDQRGQPEPLFEPWREFDHPQLGKVEIGGWHHTAWDNPLVSALEEMLEGCHRFTLELAGKHPHIVIDKLEVSRMDDKTCRINLSISNQGQLPTDVTNRGKALDRFRSVCVELDADDGIEVAERRREVGHLGAGSSQRFEWTATCARQKETIGDLVIDGGTGGVVSRRVG